ncbi:conserved hypothetical protein [Paraburkholderia tropica]
MSEAQAIKNRVNHMIELEIQRCRKAMGERQWTFHEKWVTDNIVTAAKIWLTRELQEGRL